MITMAEQWIKCAACKVRTNVVDFTVKKDKRNKSCMTCCEKAVAYQHSLKCEHGRQKSICVDCGGVGICEHKRQKTTCIECGGSQVCQHKRQKTTCIECGGSQICQHQMQRKNCKKCTAPKKVTIENWMSDSKASDKRRGQETNITRDFCAQLITDCENKCCYCAIELQMLERTANLLTIERIDNRLGHVIGNCRVACLHCNCAKVGEK